MKISVIIATYNRGAQIIHTLRSLAAQSLPRDLWEVVVVNNNSTDDTQEVFARFAAGNPDINARMIDEKNQGLSYARNRGIADSTGEYIVVIDDDEEVNTDFLKTYFEFFEFHPDVAAAGGYIVGKYIYPKPHWLSPHTERPIVGTVDLGREARPFPKGRFFGGGNMAVRRTALEKYGVFDTALGRTGKKLMSGEEKDLYNRLKAGGEQIWYLPGAEVYHEIRPERLTAGYFRRLCFQIGRSERVRTLGISHGAYARRLVMEAVKWCGAMTLALLQTLTFHPARGKFLLVMRWQITKGLLTK